MMDKRKLNKIFRRDSSTSQSREESPISSPSSPSTNGYVSVDDEPTPEVTQNTAFNSTSHRQSQVAKDDLFEELGLRHFGRIQHSSSIVCLGYVLIAISIFTFIVYVYAVIGAKLMPYTGYFVLDIIKEDNYICYLIPLMLVPAVSAKYFNWLARQHFEQNG
jgi:hypothetical protein